MQGGFSWEKLTHLTKQASISISVSFCSYSVYTRLIDRMVRDPNGKILKETSIVLGGSIVKDLHRRVFSSQCVSSRHVLPHPRKKVWEVVFAAAS